MAAMVARMRALRGRLRRSAGRDPSARRPDPWLRTWHGLELLAGVLAIGTIGYTALGLHPLTAFYQTAITITTVGYGEIAIEDANANLYRAFTVVLVLLGASSAIYTVSMIFETVVEGSINDGLRRRRMRRSIDKMQGHVIVAGWGRVGRSIVDYVTRLGVDVVVIDLAPSAAESGPPMVVGDANEDQTLLDAGIERASVLIAALNSDAENLSLTLTARSLRDDIFLVVRTSAQSNERKFFQAGANRVVNPYEIGGSRMGALALQPNVAEFLDEVLHDPTHDVAIHEVAVPEGSPLIGRTVAEASDGDDRPVIIAIRHADGRYLANPRSGQPLAASDVVIALGSDQQLANLQRAAG